MRVATAVIVLLLGLAISVGPGWAGSEAGQGSLSPDQRAAAIAQLQVQRQQVSKQMLMPPYNKGPILIHNMDRYSKLSDLIIRLHSGRPVAVDEIEQALQQPTR